MIKNKRKSTTITVLKKKKKNRDLFNSDNQLEDNIDNN